jgi:EAL domain-containing protein (putative c-di-GMP-specific phosphodiesterase class I)
MEEEIIQSNTFGYIKIDKMFIKDVENLKKEYLIIKEKIIKEIIDEINKELNKE